MKPLFTNRLEACAVVAAYVVVSAWALGSPRIVVAGLAASTVAIGAAAAKHNP